MAIEHDVAFRLRCDHEGCEERCPDVDYDVTWYVGKDALRECEMSAEDSEWRKVDGLWLCPSHWTYDDADEAVEVAA